MLVKTRKPMERIRIADNIELVVLEVRGHRVKLGIECPRHIPICRTEIENQVELLLTNKSASME
jgi:carbon storage regulator